MPISDADMSENLKAALGISDASALCDKITKTQRNNGAFYKESLMSDLGENQQPEQVCNFFRKPSKNKNIRKRTVDEDEKEDSKTEGSFLHSQKKTIKPNNKLYFSTGSSKNKMSTEAKEESEKPIFQFESSKEIQIEHDSRATATLETETEFSRDARALCERSLKQAEEALKGGGKSSGDEKLYKGIHGYTDYKAGFRREQTFASGKAGGAHGPLRASAHIRVFARFDYQPDICKDYKETGYCGYGDSCKFMHDRGDYKSGWQMEKEWDEAEKARKRNLALGLDDEDDGSVDPGEEDDKDDSLPFACFICRQPFVDAIVTKCKHYFCEHCALKHHAKNKKCFVCNKPTLGIFNTAHEIRKWIAVEGK
ncbi:zinc finger ccch domain-containing protein 1 [Quercus suber]|uniref:Zinc finger ccch domain-containing protein 1 n=1 Tax=Quercus suber TaxID=58331 RepID=A0AAW0JBI8_QUESU